MAIKKIRMRPEGTNDYADTLHPETSADQVKLVDTNNNFVATDVEGAMKELFTNVSNGKNLIATSITDKGVITNGSDTFNTMATKISQIETDKTGDATAIASDLLSGKTAYAKGVKLTGTIPSKSAQTFTPRTSNQTISSGQYLSGTQTISGSSNLTANNIKLGVDIFGVVGNVIDGAGSKKVSYGRLIPAVGSTTVHTINNLTFTPSFVYVTRVVASPTGSYRQIDTRLYSSGNGLFRDMTMDTKSTGQGNRTGTGYVEWSDSDNYVELRYDGFYFTPEVNGFTIKNMSGTSIYPIYWVAIE